MPAALGPGAAGRLQPDAARHRARPGTGPRCPAPTWPPSPTAPRPAALLAYGRQYPGSEVLIKTRLGNIRVKLYDDTPIHKANFLLLARKGVFDETMFNRVVKDFAVQGGQTYQARTIRLKRYRLPPEFRPQPLPPQRRPGHGPLRRRAEPRPPVVQHRFLLRGGRKAGAQPVAGHGRPQAHARPR